MSDKTAAADTNQIASVLEEFAVALDNNEPLNTENLIDAMQDAVDELRRLSAARAFAPAGVPEVGLRDAAESVLDLVETLSDGDLTIAGRREIADLRSALSGTPVCAKIIPYTDEDDRPDPAMNGLVMLAIGRDVDAPDHVLDRIPADAAETLVRLLSAAPTAQGQDTDDTIKRRWIIIREPGKVPVTKIPKQSHDGAREFLRECAAIYPTADITLAELAWNNDLWVSDGREALTIDDAMAEYADDADDWTDRVPEPQTAGCEFTMSYADEPNSIVCRNGHMIDIDTFTEGFDESDFFHPCPKCNADAYAAWKAENGDEDEDNDDALPSAPSAGEAAKP